MKNADKQRRRRDRDTRRERKQRIRREPEEARALILEAAHAMLAAHGPDKVGLKDIAKAAGVSHALVSHYFGTKAGLVEAVLTRNADKQQQALWDAVRERLNDGPRAWMKAYLEVAADPANARLFAWSLLGGKYDSDDFFPQRQRSMQQSADLLEAQLARLGFEVSREDVEFALLLFVVVAFGYPIGRRPAWGGLGHSASKERDDWFFSRFIDLVERVLDARR